MISMAGSLISIRKDHISIEAAFVKTGWKTKKCV
jgi:hypothetical protein